ncbi:MAG: RNA polymerase subunit sigma-70, partial [Deltaproteobacteria bacterium]
MPGLGPELDVPLADTDEEILAPAVVPEERGVVPYDPLQMYLMEIKKFRLLTREEETELAIRVREHNDQRAAYILITSNLRLVVKIAMDFHRYWTRNLLDLIQEGNVGLVQAVRKFDPYRGIKFSYYASFWIKAYILKFIMDNWKLVKIGTTQSQRKLFFNLAKERDKLIAQGFNPEPRLLAERLDVKEEEVVEMSQRLGGWEVSLSSPVSDDSRGSFGAWL